MLGKRLKKKTYLGLETRLRLEPILSSSDATMVLDLMLETSLRCHRWMAAWRWNCRRGGILVVFCSSYKLSLVQQKKKKGERKNDTYNLRQYFYPHIHTSLRAPTQAACLVKLQVSKSNTIQVCNRIGCHGVWCFEIISKLVRSPNASCDLVDFFFFDTPKSFNLYLQPHVQPHKFKFQRPNRFFKGFKWITVPSSAP
jgi:hypothetical protein